MDRKQVHIGWRCEWIESASCLRKDTPGLVVEFGEGRTSRYRIASAGATVVVAEGFGSARPDYVGYNCRQSAPA